MKDKNISKTKFAPIKAREVICPYCMHKFMWMNGETNECRIIEYKKNGRIVGKHVKCPMCSIEFVMIAHKIDGITKEDAMSKYEVVELIR